MVATGRTISSLIDIKIYRRGAVGTGPVQFKQFDIHYRKDGLGSDQEFTKTF
jgi:hypothetical protein